MEIQEKYPNAEHSLTEFEKDLALQRYLIKTGQEAEEEVDHSIQIKQKLDKKDTIIAQAEDVVSESPVKDKFKIAYYTSLAVFVLVSLICFAAGPGVAFIMLGVTAVIFGGIGAFFHKKLKVTKGAGTDKVAKNNGK